MRVATLKWALRIGAFALAAAALADGGYKAATVSGPGRAGGVTQADILAVNLSGGQFEDAQGTPMAELWISKTITPATSPSTESDIVYSALTPGTFLGILKIEKPIKDFRGQKIQMGEYTMRYELVPQDGNHMGVSDNRDFVALIPAAFDPDPTKALDLKQVVDLSRKATNTGHPAVLEMDQAKSGTSPLVFQDDNQDWALQMTGGLKTASGDTPYPVAIVLVGVSNAVQQ